MLEVDSVSRPRPRRLLQRSFDEKGNWFSGLNPEPTRAEARAFAERLGDRLVSVSENSMANWGAYRFSVVVTYWSE
jgi:hypothetical protein